ncbi:tRNA 4-thiouridine(8) synthase ThiI [Tissierella carlieri]|uniref:tRNA uracil 4-sulfurtransferase ThiI n=1 Tax=Tissierella TaxID=41273 RepID=UPI000BA1695A|nr:tRNA uracil 4-sulfurtransferase ThiI [Tissierella sp. P1]MBU5313364.1 tRNA 4-thiouridine(8) synthase ThiI [Tissierella carlieri]MDU5082649.1 tRNA uracil 4-sulfurtransferase ThiI [Bacillota bacterium]OZV10549.1 tRNA 4-thiouridine(8) synthase ThiI [Tissierella sp. P1]
MDKVLSVSLGEIALKGLNRKYFEDQLIKHIRRAIKDIGFEKIYKEQGKIYIQAEEQFFPQMINRLRKVFGLVYISPCIKVEKDVDEIENAVLKAVKEKIEGEKIKTFKVDTNRADKNFPIKSPDFSKQMGGVILKAFNELSVDVHTPDTLVYIDIKQNAYIYTDKIKGHGGMPIGTNGKGLLLLSGGIDSPVAGFLMAKRGVEISAVHYHSYPFTSERAEEKVKDLAGILSRYTGKITMYSVNILEIQKEINAKCPEKEMTILSRRFMMRIAERIAEKQNINALITGESLGQVASQTIEGISVTNAAVKLPILRPLVGLDKVDIIEIAKDIETFETSTLPFEDCCTVFLPKHPVTKPRIEDIEKSEEVLDVDYLIDNVIENMKVTTIE